jgi:hypothetical protein
MSLKSATNHGGARRGAGRPPKPGWKLCGFRLEISTIERVQYCAKERAVSQSALVNEILKRRLRKVT